MQNIKIEQFEKEIITFIRNHPYLKEQETKADIDHYNGGATITIPTVNGEFERILIKIIYE